MNEWLKLNFLDAQLDADNHLSNQIRVLLNYRQSIDRHSKKPHFPCTLLNYLIRNYRA